MVVQGRWERQADDLQRDMERFLEHVSRGKSPRPTFARRGWRPAVDLYETGDSFVVLAELSGVPEQQLQVVVEGTSLTISGQRENRCTPAMQRCHQMEIEFGAFERVIELPAPVNTENCTARFEGGMLEITLPKARARPRTIRIPVQGQ